VQYEYNKNKPMSKKSSLWTTCPENCRWWDCSDDFL